MSAKGKKARKRRKPLKETEQGGVSEFQAEYSNFSREEFSDDIVFLLRSDPESLRGPDAAANFVVKTVLPTSEMATEPEFENIVHEPSLCVKTLHEVAQGMGINWETFANLPKPIMESVRMQISEETLKRVLDDRFREKILDGLDEYRLRKKRKNDRMEAGKAAAMMLILKEKKNEEVWPKIGLLHEILHNCVAIGQEIMDSVKGLKEGKVNGINEKVLSRIKDDDQLRQFLLGEVNRRIVDGNNALLDGRLKLDWFTREEIDRASEILVEAFKTGVDPESKNEGSLVPKYTEEGQEMVTSGLGAIIDDVVTPERIEDARKKVEEKLKGDGEGGNWGMFLVSVKSKLEKEPEPEKLKGLFIRALYGETATAKGESS